MCVCVWFRHGHEWWWYEGNTHTLFLSLSLSLSFLPFSSLSHSPSLVPPLFLHLSPFVSLSHTHTRTHTYSPFSKGRRIVRVMSEVWGCEIVDTSSSKTLVLDIWNIVYVSKHTPNQNVWSKYMLKHVYVNRTFLRVRSRIQKLHSCWPRTAEMQFIMCFKKRSQSNDKSRFQSLLYSNSTGVYIRLKFIYWVISVKLYSLPAMVARQA